MTEENLKRATAEFLDSKYGKYVMRTLEEMKDAFLSDAETNRDAPLRSLDKHTAIKEVIRFVRSPLE